MKYGEKYTKEKLSKAVENNVTVAGVLRELGITPSGGMHSHVSKKIRALALSTEHFLGSGANRGAAHCGGHEKLLPNDILVRNRNNGRREQACRLRRALLETGRKPICELCGLVELWCGKPLTLPIDHKDGNFSNNLEGNLRFLCPNCHSQTESFNQPKKK